MVIGIDASRANLEHKTGTEWYSFHLIKNLAVIDRKNNYRLYISTAPSPELVAAVQDNPNFSFKQLNWPFHSFWTLGRLSWEMIWRRPDVLFVPAHALPLIFPRRTVNTIHDIAFVREQNLYRCSKVKTDLRGVRYFIDFVVRIFTYGRYGSDSVDYLRWSTDFALRRAWRIISVSEFTRREILDFYHDTKADKIRVVYNSHDRKIYRPISDETKTAEVLRHYNLSGPYLLYVGRLEKKKNIQTLIDAFALMREDNPNLRDFKLVLAGDAGFGFDAIKYEIEQFNLNAQVLMPGWIKEEDLPYIFNGARAFVFPSRHEGFGIPVLEALGCGVPTAASDLPVIKEIAGEAVLYFDPTDKNSLAQAMALISSDESVRVKLRQLGLARAEQFSWEKCAQDTLAIFEETDKH